MAEHKGRGETWALAARYLLLAGIVLAGGLLFAKMREQNGTGRSGLPKLLTPAQAEAVSAAPGYLMFTTDVGGQRKFYLFDSNKKVVCVYSLTGDALRLVAAREVSYDQQIVDTSMAVRALDGSVIRSPEGGTGITRETARKYAEGQQKLLKELDERKRRGRR